MQYRFFRILFAIAVCLLPLASALAAPVETVLHHFENSPIGYDPQSGVIADDNGRLFGTTYSGGASLLARISHSLFCDASFWGVGCRVAA